MLAGPGDVAAPRGPGRGARQVPREVGGSRTPGLSVPTAEPQSLPATLHGDPAQRLRLASREQPYSRREQSVTDLVKDYLCAAFLGSNFINKREY